MESQSQNTELEEEDEELEETRDYVNGRCIRPKGWNRVRQEILDTFGQTATLLFLGWLQTFLQIYLNNPGARLPCNSNLDLQNNYF